MDFNCSRFSYTFWCCHLIRRDIWTFSSICILFFCFVFFRNPLMLDWVSIYECNKVTEVLRIKECLPIPPSQPLTLYSPNRPPCVHSVCSRRACNNNKKTLNKNFIVHSMIGRILLSQFSSHARQKHLGLFFFFFFQQYLVTTLVLLFEMIWVNSGLK